MRLCIPQRDGITRTVRVDPALRNAVEHHITRSKHIRRKRPNKATRDLRKLHKYNVKLDLITWRLMDARKKVDLIMAKGVKIEAKRDAIQTEINAHQMVAASNNQQQNRVRGNDNQPGGQQQPAPSQGDNSP